jgi:hypothetical protein
MPRKRGENENEKREQQTKQRGLTQDALKTFFFRLTPSSHSLFIAQEARACSITMLLFLPLNVISRSSRHRTELGSKVAGMHTCHLHLGLEVGLIEAREHLVTFERLKVRVDVHLNHGNTGMTK